MVVGIDPAPAKAAAIVFGSGVDTSTRDTSSWLDEQRRSHQRVLVAWDAPISFSPAFGYSDRPIDKAIRAFLATQVQANRLAKAAVSALPFSGCPHWAITCGVLGRPFGAGAGSEYRVPATKSDLAGAGAYVIEVHPAVTLGLWWMAENPGKPMLRYKPGGGLPGSDVRRNLEALAPLASRRTGLPDRFFETDDLLDASVAWTMARQFVSGDAIWVGAPDHGGYVLPKEEAEGHQLQRLVDGVVARWK